ncbi:OmpH family outer membrane protein [Zunongwangia sp. F363]|uniref:OmpH family outer membrane protein n=1 Tax=Autumnicola tepida TaxID=3075595 RepID=A0ABU3CEB7_9FLAO|nr:OmpH family outer membrane protein [Zunongwangia sp. F363]MDT0644694.1 OmpH family outer membrane protein [Zunongwangia sp. F363]
MQDIQDFKAFAEDGTSVASPQPDKMAKKLGFTNLRLLYLRKTYNKMKKTGLLFTLLFVSVMASAQTKTGTIDADYILSQMPEITNVNKGLEEYNTELQADLQKNIDSYEGLVGDYQENNTSFTDEQKKQKETEIIGLENEIKGFRQKASVMLQMKRNELTKPLYEKIDAAMRKVIAAEGYTHILNAGGNSLAFASEEYDITLKVMKEMGISAPAPAPAPAQGTE